MPRLKAQLQQAKHNLFLWTLKNRIHPSILSQRRRNWLARNLRHFPRPTYDRTVAHLERAFIAHDSKLDTEPSAPVIRRVFSFWTGTNPITPNRAKNISQLQRQLGIPHILVTPEDLEQWILPTSPLHTAYPLLSAVHKSDYLRAYFAHHHGGGYADIKAPTGPWNKSFDTLDQQPEVWLVGAPNHNSFRGDSLSPKIEHAVWRSSFNYTSQAAFIARPRSPLTAAWIDEINHLLDYYQHSLEKAPGGLRDEVLEYPIPWNRINEQVFHPLQYKYLDHVALRSEMTLILSDYR